MSPPASAVCCLTLAVLAFIFVYAHKDFKAYLALGPGGTPPTIAGYLKIKLLGLVALRDPCKAPPLSDKQQTPLGYLRTLPARTGPRPTTAGIAPHRQLTQKASAELVDELTCEIQRMGSTSPGLMLGTSCFEKHSTGIFSTSPLRVTCNGEICHTHPSDGSSHAVLHPADVKVALEAGWVERHPLARGGWFERFVPAGFVMAYAPRTSEELRVVAEIVEAAAWFVGGARCGGECGGKAEAECVRREMVTN